MATLGYPGAKISFIPNSGSYVDATNPKNGDDHRPSKIEASWRQVVSADTGSPTWRENLGAAVF